MSHLTSSIHWYSEDEVRKAETDERETAARLTAGLTKKVAEQTWYSDGDLTETAAAIEVHTHLANRIHALVEAMDEPCLFPYQPGELSRRDHLALAIYYTAGTLLDRILRGPDDTWSGPNFRNAVAQEKHQADLALYEAYRRGFPIQGDDGREYLSESVWMAVGFAADAKAKAEEKAKALADAEAHDRTYGLRYKMVGKKRTEVTSAKVSGLVKKVLPDANRINVDEVNGYYGKSASGILVTTRNGEGAVAAVFAPENISVWDQEQGCYVEKPNTAGLATAAEQVAAIATVLGDAGLTVHVVARGVENEHVKPQFSGQYGAKAFAEIHATGWDA